MLEIEKEKKISTEGYLNHKLWKKKELIIKYKIKKGEKTIRIIEKEFFVKNKENI